MTKKLISIVVPVFNEEDNIPRLYQTLNTLLLELSDRYSFEIVFTDNHSTDKSFEILSELATSDSRIRVIRFTRNFGFQASIATAYNAAKGDAAIQLDCDLQDPPSLIKAFLEHWEKGYKVVYGIRRSRKEGWLITKIRKLFYRVINKMCEYHLPVDSGDFRLVDRCILNELKNINNHAPYLRGEIARMGYPQIGVEYDRAERLRGKSKFSFGELCKLAFDGIISHSIAPLRFATYTGLTISFITLIVFIGYFIVHFTLGANWPRGFTTLTLLILLSIALNACFLGIIGEYLGRIYNQSIKRPLTIIEKEVDTNTIKSSTEIEETV